MRVDPRSAGRQFRNHFFVDFVHQRFRKNFRAIPDWFVTTITGISRLIQLADGFGGIRKNLKAVDVIDISHFLADRAVAVQKHGAAQRLRFRHSRRPEQKDSSATF